MEAQRIVVLVIDRANSSYLGPYGNTWVETPNLNAFAAQSFLLDRALIDCPELEQIYRALWHGRHAVTAMGPPPPGQAAVLPLARRLADAAWNNWLLSDDPLVMDHPLAGDWQRRELLAVPNRATVADSIEATHWAALFGTASGWIGEAPGRTCFWLHTSALGITWDAPLELRERYTDPEDPPPDTSTAVPREILPADYDPDRLLVISHAYAAQMSLLDTCLGCLLDAVDSGPLAESTLVAVLGARGMPLGEHRRVGLYDDRLYGELVQIPWLMRFPDGRGAADRTQALVQLPDLFPTLLNWAGLSASEHFFSRSLLPLIDGQVEQLRDRGCAVADNAECAIQTSGWALRFVRAAAESEPDTGSADVELFSKPDDRFELNDVARRCPEIVTELQQAYSDSTRLDVASDPTSAPPPLPAALLAQTD